MEIFRKTKTETKIEEKKYEVPDETVEKVKKAIPLIRSFLKFTKM